MHAALYLSYQMGNITEAEYQQSLATIQAYGLPISVAHQQANEILTATKSDKKMIGKQIKFIILNHIGEAAIYRDFSDAQLMDAIAQILV
jgi:3-dehydroquinate synthase